MHIPPFFSWLLPEQALAQGAIITGGIPGCDFFTGQLSAACIPFFIAHLIQTIFGLTGIFFVLNVMYAGYEIALGAATGTGRESGMRRIQWSIIGFVICVCSFLILDFVITILAG